MMMRGQGTSTPWQSLAQDLSPALISHDGAIQDTRIINVDRPVSNNMFESFRSLKNNGTSNIVKLLEIPFPVMLPIRSGLTLSGKHGVAAYAVQTLFYD